MSKILRKLIREEIIKALSENKSVITEKFQSRTLSHIFTKFRGGDKKFFDKTAKSRNFDWANMPDNAIRQGANPSNNFMNIFFVDSNKRNPFETGWEGTLMPGIIGITIGKQSMYWPDNRWRSSSSSANMVGNQGRKLDNYKRYNKVADTIYSIDLSKVPSNAEIKKARAEAKQGATALLKAKGIKDENLRRYKKALQDMVAVKGPDELKRMLDEATKVVQKVFEFSTNMIKKDMSTTMWDNYSSVTSRYGDMVRAFENFAKETRNYEKSKKGDPDSMGDSWYKDYVNRYAGEVKEYYKQLLTTAKKVLNKDNWRSNIPIK